MKFQGILEAILPREITCIEDLEQRSQVKGETLGGYLQGEGDGEICRGQTYPMERRRIP
jgi:hypothetical protein